MRAYGLDLALSATVTTEGAGARADDRAHAIGGDLVGRVKAALANAGLDVAVDALDCTIHRGTRGAVIFEHGEGAASCMAR